MSAEPQLLIVGCLALLALMLGVSQLLVVRRLQREIEELRSQIAAQPAKEVAKVNFSASLDAAERQQLQTPPPMVPRNSAEKYRYVGSLADQGLDADSIAKALQMSTAEVEQLLQLVKLRTAARPK